MKMLRPDNIFFEILHYISSDIHWAVAPTYYDIFDTKIKPGKRDRIHNVSEYRSRYLLLRVDPGNITEITRRQVPFARDQWNLCGSIVSGEWDIRPDFIYAKNWHKQEWFKQVFPTISFNKSVFHQSLINHFVNGVDWFNTNYIQVVHKNISNGKSVWHGCNTIRDVRERCLEVDELYHQIKRNNYKSQKELGKSFYRTAQNEIMVDINRDGKLLFVDGRHRLSIAKILDLNEIPVIVGNIHPKFLNKSNNYDFSEMAEFK